MFSEVENNGALAMAAGVEAIAESLKSYCSWSTHKAIHIIEPDGWPWGPWDLQQLSSGLLGDQQGTSRRKLSISVGWPTQGNSPYELYWDMQGMRGTSDVKEC